MKRPGPLTCQLTRYFKEKNRVEDSEIVTSAAATLSQRPSLLITSAGPTKQKKTKPKGITATHSYPSPIQSVFT